MASPDPFNGIHAAVTRQREDGSPAGGWHPDQRLTVEQAVRGYTMGPALATGRGHELGSIRPGKGADFIVLDRDIYRIDPGEILGTAVEMTVCGGRVVFERDGG